MPNPADDAAIRRELGEMAGSITDSQFERVLAAYRATIPGVTRQELMVLVGTCGWMWRNTVTQAGLKAAQGGAPTYAYRFDWRTPCFGGEWAVHGAEVPLALGNIDYPDPMWDAADTPALRAKADPAGGRYRVQDAMLAAWAAFARTGNPSNPHLTTWPAYTLERRSTMVLNLTSRVVDDPDAEIRKIIGA